MTRLQIVDRSDWMRHSACVKRPLSSSRSEESAVDSRVEDADPLVTSRGFFASLWGTVSGQLGTGSGAYSTDGEERTRRR